MKPRLDMRQKRIEARLLDWCGRQLPKAFWNANFDPVLELFLPHEQLLQVVRDPRASVSIDHFFEILGPWDWEEYNDELWAEFRSASEDNKGPLRSERTVKKSQNTPRRKSQNTPQANTPQVTSWAAVDTPSSIAMSLSSQQPRRKPAATTLQQPPDSPSMARGMKRQVLGELSSNIQRGSSVDKRQRLPNQYTDITS